MGNIYFKMGEHPKALKLYRMALDQTPTAEKDLRYPYQIFFVQIVNVVGMFLGRL